MTGPAPVQAQGHPRELMTPCGHTGPYGWINHLGHVVPITCNRPQAHTGPHGYSTRNQAMKHRWESSDQPLRTAYKKGPWATVQLVP